MRKWIVRLISFSFSIVSVGAFHKAPTMSVPSTHEEGDFTPLQLSRKRARDLHLAAENSPTIRDSLLPYPSAANADTIASVFGIKRKQVCRESTRLRNANRERPCHIYFVFNKPVGCMSARASSNSEATTSHPWLGNKKTIYDNFHISLLFLLAPSRTLSGGLST